MMELTLLECQLLISAIEAERHNRILHSKPRMARELNRLEKKVRLESDRRKAEQ